MDPSSGLAQIAQLGARSLATSAEAIAAVTDLVQRWTGIDITVTSEITDDQQYVFRGIEKRLGLPVERDSAMPFSMMLLRAGDGSRSRRCRGAASRAA